MPTFVTLTTPGPRGGPVIADIDKAYTITWDDSRKVTHIRWGFDPANPILTVTETPQDIKAKVSQKNPQQIW